VRRRRDNVSTQRSRILKDTNDYPAEQYYLDAAAFVVVCALADHEAEAGDPHRAIETYEQLAKTAAVTDFEDAPRLSRLYEALSRLYLKTGDPAKADSTKARRVQLWQNWNRKFPNNAFVLHPDRSCQPLDVVALTDFCANSAFQCRFPL